MNHESVVTRWPNCMVLGDDGMVLGSPVTQLVSTGRPGGQIGDFRYPECGDFSVVGTSEM